MSISKHMKLKHQLAIMIAFSIAMLLIVEIFYYYRISSVIRHRAEVYTESTLNQIAEKLSFTSTQIIQTADLMAQNKYTQQLLTENDPKTRFELNNYVSEIMSYVKTSDNIIYNIVFVDPLQRVISLRSLNEYILNYYNKNYSIFSTTQKLPLFSGITKDIYENQYYYSYLRPVFKTSPGSNPKEKIGTCIVVCKANNLYNLFDNISITKSSTFLILDTENNVVTASSNYRQMIGKQADSTIIGLMNSSNMIKTYNGKRSLILNKPLPDTGWNIISITPLNEITDDLTPTRNYGVVIIIGVSILLGILGIVFNNNITRPIAHIIGFISNPSNKNFKQRLKMKEENEIGQLTVYINHMLDETEQATQKIISTQASLYETELAKKYAELSALQSQINPHFLYNTLDCIQGIGYSYNSKEIVTITSSLSKIMRYSIKSSDRVSISNELECVKNYMSIIAIRFSGKYTYEFEISPEILDLEIIKLILQPIVENAVYHGLERRSGDGCIKIRGFLKDGKLIQLEVQDNGRGMTGQELEALNHFLDTTPTQSFLVGNEKRSIGLININKRIKEVYGYEYGIKIFSLKDEGTTVTIEFPLVDTSTHQNAN